MIGNVPDSSVYTDFSGLTELKAAARQNSPEAVAKVAGQFEAMLLQMVLKSAREAQLGDGLFDSNALDNYHSMYDQQLALQLSEGRGLGLKAVLVRQLAQLQPATPDPAQTFAVPPRSAVSTPAAMVPTAPLPPTLAVSEPKISTDAPAVEPQVIEPEPPFAGQADFVARLWPLARDAASQLGVAPEVLIAQAALETGWGKAVIQGPDGSSHNLFNIKADGRWDGPSVGKSTLEFKEGIAVKEQARFRSYDSWADSFQDYVHFIQGQPRYQEALKVADDAAAYLKGLQEAGYATDPAYADKIHDILTRSTFQSAAVTLKSDAEGPIT